MRYVRDFGIFSMQLAIVRACDVIVEKSASTWIDVGVLVAMSVVAFMVGWKRRA